MKRKSIAIPNLKHIAYLFMSAVLVASLISWQAPFFAGAEEDVSQGEVITEEIGAQDATVQASDLPVDPSFEGNPPVEGISEEGAAQGDVPAATNVVGDVPAEGTAQTFAAPAPQASGLAIGPQEIKTGVFGDCEWSFNTDIGELTIGAGTLASATKPEDWPWFTFLGSIKYVNFTGDVKAAEDAFAMFRGMINLQSIWNLNRLDTSTTKNLGTMFQNCNSLTSLDLSEFSTDEATNLESLFVGCTTLKTLDISNFNTEKATNLGHMFSNCTNLETIIFPTTFTSGEDANMSYLFSFSSKLSSLDLSSFDTSKVTDMSYMFASCKGLKSIDLSPLETQRVENMAGMFSYCDSLVSLDLSPFETPALKNMYGMFSNCKTLRTLDLTMFDTADVTDMRNMFALCTGLESVELSSFDTGKVTRMDNMFQSCTSIRSLDISTFETTKVENMGSMFISCSSLIQLHLGDNFTFLPNHYLPSPEGWNDEGKPYTGNWEAVTDLSVYPANGIPNQVADTYNAEVFDTELVITGVLTQGETLTGALTEAGGYEWTYHWSRGDRAGSTPVAIPGATGQTYTTTASDVGKYIHCTATYQRMKVSNLVGPIIAAVPNAPTLNSATLVSNGTVTLNYTTAATTVSPYTHIIVEYKPTGSGSWKPAGERVAPSSAIETKTVDINLASILGGASVPSEIEFRIKAKGATGESEWSNTVSTNPQVSVTVPTSMAGLITGTGDITAPSQVIENTGNLNLKITNIAMTKDSASYPTSTWECYQESDLVTPLWQGNSSASGSVTTSPLVTPGTTLSLKWLGTMTNTDGLMLSASPVPYGSIIYTVGFSQS